MPNHCMNTLWLTGDVDQINDLIERVNNNKNGDNELQILKTFHPCPVELLETDATYGKPKDEKHALQLLQNKENYGATDWYSWCIENWGTKWGDYETYYGVNENGTHTYSFTSAWSPPVKGFEYISKMFPDITFIHHFSEEGMGFYGLVTYKGGAILMEESCDYGNLDGYEKACEEDRYDDAWELVNDAMIDLMVKAGVGHLVGDLPTGPQGF